MAPPTGSTASVARVDALRAPCDRLGAALTAPETTRARLLAALRHEALDPAAPLAPKGCGMIHPAPPG